MRFSLCEVFVALSSLTLASAQLNAVAVLTTTTGSINGTFTFTSESDQGPLDVSFTVSGLVFPNTTVQTNGTAGMAHPAGGYMYHIHKLPINAAGSCASAGSHLDPTLQGAGANKTDYKCDPEDWDLCELGDLAGKHGNIDESTEFPVDYSDDSEGLTDPAMPDHYILGRSIVLHNAAGARIACGNITVAGAPLPPTTYITSNATTSTNSTAAGGASSTTKSNVSGNNTNATTGQTTINGGAGKFTGTSSGTLASFCIFAVAAGIFF